jgi:hypothetical protein
MLLFAAFNATSVRTVAPQALPSLCGTLGTEGYTAPHLKLPPIHPKSGIVITVTTVSDDSDGDVSSVTALLRNPGPDGTISLWEAIEATNNSPGNYTVRFAPSLKDSTIFLKSNLPPLLGGNLLIDGNVGNGSIPDITLEPAVGSIGYPPLSFASSRNILYALRIENFPTSIGLSPGKNGTVLNGNIASSLIVVPGGNRSNGGGWGIDLEFFFNSGDTLRQTYIINNTVSMPAGMVGSGAIVIGPGVGSKTDNNTVDGAIIAGNILNGSFEDAALQVRSGELDSGAKLENVTVVGNRIQVPTTFGPFNGNPQGAQNGGIILVGYRAIGDVFRDVSVLNNTISGKAGNGIRIDPGGSGSENARFTNIKILGNTMSTEGSGLSVNDDVDQGIGSTGDSVSNLTIQSNTIVDNASGGFTKSGGIVIQLGYGAKSVTVDSLSVSRNLVTANDIGINLVAGIGFPSLKATNDTIVDVLMSCNDVVNSPISLEKEFPGIKGISLVGGYLNSTGNTLKQVQLVDNLVAGIPNDFYAQPILGQGAVGSSLGPLIISSHYQLAVGQNRYVVTVATNSSIANLSFIESSRSLTFAFDGPSTGFVSYLNAIFPKSLLNGTLTVTADDRPVNFKLTQNSTTYFLYATYRVGTSSLQIAELNPTTTTTSSATTSSTSSSNTTTTTSTTSSLTTSTSITESSSQTTSARGGGIPEFSVQALAASGLVIAVVLSYLVVRRRISPKLGTPRIEDSNAEGHSTILF